MWAFLAACMTATLLTGAPAFAQTINEPAAVERTIPRPEPDKKAAPAVRTSVPVESEAVIEGSFVLGAVHIEGATKFSPAELAEDYEPFLATSVDDVALKQITSRITQRYRDAGYVLSYASLPAQDVRAGIVRINVVEGYIDHVEVEGVGPDKTMILDTAAPMMQERPLRTRTLERALGLMRDLSGVSVTDVRLGRVEGSSAAHVLTVVVALDTMRALVYADNRKTAGEGHLRLYSSFALSSLAATGDEFRVDLFAIPGKSYHYLYGQLAATMPLGSDGWRLGLSTAMGDQHQKFAGMSLNAKTQNISAELSYPVLRSRALSAVTSLAITDWRSTADLADVDIQEDRLKVAHAALKLSGEKTTWFEINLGLSQGLNLGNITRLGDPLASRPDASGRFTKAEFSAHLVQPIAKDVRLQLVAAGQYASRPLLSVEEFALGGSRIGRAYDFNTLTGDHGIAGLVEIGFRLPEMTHGPRQLELYTYADGGGVFQSGELSGTNKSRGLASVGSGARFAISRIAISVELGVPLMAVGTGKSARGFLTASTIF